jgi:hypothetical protein
MICPRKSNGADSPLAILSTMRLWAASLAVYITPVSNTSSPVFRLAIDSSVRGVVIFFIYHNLSLLIAWQLVI